MATDGCQQRRKALPIIDWLLIQTQQSYPISFQLYHHAMDLPLHCGFINPVQPDYHSLFSCLLSCIRPNAAVATIAIQVNEENYVAAFVEVKSQLRLNWKAD